MTAAVVILLAVTGFYVLACVLEACAPDVGATWLPEAERDADMCHNWHPFEAGRSTDHAADESDPRWCNVCGEARPEPVERGGRP